MSLLIEVNRVSYSHPVPGGPPHPALRDISFQINAGEHIAIVGANGSGKTTLARHLNALFVPDSGTIRSHGSRYKRACQPHENSPEGWNGVSIPAGTDDCHID